MGIQINYSKTYLVMSEQDSSTRTDVAEGTKYWASIG